MGKHKKQNASKSKEDSSFYSGRKSNNSEPNSSDQSRFKKKFDQQKNKTRPLQQFFSRQGQTATDLPICENSLLNVSVDNPEGIDRPSPPLIPHSDINKFQKKRKILQKDKMVRYKSDQHRIFLVQKHIKYLKIEKIKTFLSQVDVTDDYGIDKNKEDHNNPDKKMFTYYLLCFDSDGHVHYFEDLTHLLTLSMNNDKYDWFEVYFLTGPLGKKEEMKFDDLKLRIYYHKPSKALKICRISKLEKDKGIAFKMKAVPKGRREMKRSFVHKQS